MKFLAPGYLLGLALMALPVIIHLWYRRRMKKVPFSSLEFLKKIEARKLGWLRLREILILACRCLLVGLLFFSLSRPQLGGENRRASVFIILDNTYSMGYADNFAQARKAAGRLIAGYAPNAEFYVTGLASGDSGDFFWMTRAEAQEKIKKIEPTFHSGTVTKVLDQHPVRDPAYPLEYVYVGDGQELNFRDFIPPPAAIFYWVRIRTGSNAGFVQVSPRELVRRAAESYPVTVRLRNYASKLWPGRIEVTAGSFFIQKDNRIPAGQEAEEALTFPGNNRCGEAVWLGDSLEADNHYYFAFNRPAIRRVLIVGPGGLLERALNPSPELQTPFSVHTRDRLESSDIRPYDVIILDGLPDLTETETRRLDNFLTQKNRAVLCFLGDRVGENLRKFLERVASIGEPVSPRGYAVLDQVDYDHYAFAPFKGTATLKEVKFYKFWNFTRRGRAIAALNAGYDLVVLRDNLAVVGTRFERDYTDLVYKAAFVPLVHRLVWSLILPQSGREYKVGDRSDYLKTLTGPRDRRIGLNEMFDEPGLYSGEGDTIAVNVAAEEGNLKPMGENMQKVLGIREWDLDRKRGLGDLSWFALILALAMILVEQVLLLI